MNAKELEKILLKNGWKAVRQVGGHKMFKKDNNPYTIPVSFHSRKEIPIGTLHSILKKAGLK